MRLRRVLVTISSSEMISGDADSSWGDFDADDSIELLLELLALDMGAVLPIAVEGSSMMKFRIRRDNSGILGAGMQYPGFRIV